MSTTSRSSAPLLTTLRTPITQRSSRASEMMQPSEITALRMVTELILLAGRNRARV